MARVASSNFPPSAFTSSRVAFTSTPTPSIPFSSASTFFLSSSTAGNPQLDSRANGSAGPASARLSRAKGSFSGFTSSAGMAPGISSVFFFAHRAPSAGRLNEASVRPDVRVGMAPQRSE